MVQRLQPNLDPTFDEQRPTLQHTPIDLHPDVVVQPPKPVVTGLKIQSDIPTNSTPQVFQLSPTTTPLLKSTIKTRTKILLLKILGISATVTILSFFVFNYPKPKPPVQPIHVKSTHISSNVAPPPVIINNSLPARLKIPALNVNAAVSYLGRTPTGNMASPKNIVSVGWYKYGALPGNTGSAVIVGHLDGLEGQPGVFSNLDKLQRGDSITVVDDNGQTTSFVVQNIQAYNQNETLSTVFSSTSGSHLNLITCTGAWDSGQRRYLQRLVVFADKV